MAKKRQESDRVGRLAMPLNVNNALRGAMEIPPPSETKTKKRKKARGAKKKRKK